MIKSATKNFFTFGILAVLVFGGYIASSMANAPDDATKAAAPVAVAANAVSSTPAPSMLATLQENKHYITKFPNSNRAKGPVVVEFFSYMCPHCYRMESTVKRWINQKPDDVEFVKIPVSFKGNAMYAIAARAHYIAEELGILEQFSPAMFNRIHVDRRPPRNDRDLANLFAELGISEADFKKASENNFNVESKLRRANFLLEQYQVNSVPYFLVNYKYELGPESNKGQDNLFNIWNNLPYKDFN